MSATETAEAPVQQAQEGNTQSTALAVAPASKLLAVWDRPDTQEKIRALLPPTMSFDRFSRLTVSLLNRNPQLAEAARGDPVSFFMCLNDCALIGVYPDPVTGKAYLIPRWNSKKQRQEVTLLVGYKGLRSIALRSPDIVDIWTGVVRNGDVFKLVRAPRQEITHEIAPEETGEIIGYYSCAALKSGLTSFEWMTVADIEKVKAQAMDKLKDWQKEQSPWKTWESEMARKTVLRRHFKNLPIRDEDQEAIEREHDREMKRVTEDPDQGAAAALLTNGAPSGRAELPARRGSARAAAEVAETPEATPAPASQGEDSTRKNENAAEPAAVVPPAAAVEAEAPKATEQKPAETKTRTNKKAEEPKPVEKVAPDVAPGVNLAGFHGKAWPQVLRLTIRAIDRLAVTPAGRPVAIITAEAEGHQGALKFVTFEGVALGADRKPAINSPLLEVGREIEANVKANLRPKPDPADKAKTVLNYDEPPALYAEGLADLLEQV